MRRPIKYIKAIKTRNKTINVVIKIDINNKPVVSCSFFPSNGKKTMPDYYNIVLPANVIEGIPVMNESGEDITNKKIITNAPRSSNLKQFNGEVLEITPAELVSQLKIIKRENAFNEEEQRKFALAKAPHWDFTYLQSKWIAEVNKAIGEDNKEIKLAVALDSWDTNKNKVTLGQSLLNTKIILFNQKYYLSYDEKTFKQVYTHELAHIYNHQKFGTLGVSGHNAGWISKNYELNKKVFGNKDANVILATDLLKYGTNVIHHLGKPDIEEYWEMKDQESLALVAQTKGWMIESNNEFIQNINKNLNLKTTVQDVVQENSDKVNEYNQWVPMARISNSLSIAPVEAIMKSLNIQQTSFENQNQQFNASFAKENKERGR